MRLPNKITVFATTALLFTALVPASAFALAATSNASDQVHLITLKTRGDAEINRRLNTLNKLDSVISSTVKLSATDKSNLTTQVNNEVTDLTSLKTKLDADTDLATAQADAQTIISDYRAYALIAPKVYLLKSADTELVNDSKLTTLAGKLQSRITTDQTAGKDVANLQTSLNDLNAKVSAAQSIANAVNAKVTPLLPADYDSDHTILAGQRDQLKTAHQDNVAAYNNAKSIVSSLKNF